MEIITTKREKLSTSLGRITKDCFRKKIKSRNKRIQMKASSKLISLKHLIEGKSNSLYINKTKIETLIIHLVREMIDNHHRDNLLRHQAKILPLNQLYSLQRIHRDKTRCSMILNKIFKIKGTQMHHTTRIHNSRMNHNIHLYTSQQEVLMGLQRLQSQLNQVVTEHLEDKRPKLDSIVKMMLNFSRNYIR